MVGTLRVDALLSPVNNVERLDSDRASPTVLPYVTGVLRRVVSSLPAIRSWINVVGREPLLHPFHCWLMFIPVPWALGRLFSSFCQFWIMRRRGFPVAVPRINLRREITSIRFPELTPEESDRFSTPRQNRPKSVKLGGNKSPF